MRTIRATVPIIVYYDASCPLCRKEIQALKDHDPEDRLHVVDCSAPDFRDEIAERDGIAAAEMMRLMHVRDADGHWLVGVDAFALIYGVIGIESMAKVWSHPVLRPIWKRLYPWVAANRMMLSRFGLNRAFDAWVRWLAKRAQRRANACTEGACRS